MGLLFFCAAGLTIAVPVRWPDTVQHQLQHFGNLSTGKKFGPSIESNKVIHITARPAPHLFFWTRIVVLLSALLRQGCLLQALKMISQAQGKSSYRRRLGFL
jgi:hypothetical protein